jgi:hypothetical protein
MQRKASYRSRYQHVAVDLLDAEDTKRKLAELMDVTHVFYAAFQATAGSDAEIKASTLPMAIISGGGTSGPKSQRPSKCRFQIPKQFTSSSR